MITVGAVKTGATTNRLDDMIASYSSKGPTLFDHIVKPDIVAPGNKIISVRAENASLVQTYPQIVVASDVYKNGSGRISPDYVQLS